MNQREQQNQPDALADDFRILIGGSLDEAFGDLIASMIETQFLQQSRKSVSVTSCELLDDLLREARDGPFDLVMLYLHFLGFPNHTTDLPEASPTQRLAFLTDSRHGPHYVSNAGLQVVAYLKDVFSTPIVVLTGSGRSPDLAARITEAGAAAFLPLPFDQHEFKNTMEPILDKTP